MIAFPIFLVALVLATLVVLFVRGERLDRRREVEHNAKMRELRR